MREGSDRHHACAIRNAYIGVPTVKGAMTGDVDGRRGPRVRLWIQEVRVPFLLSAAIVPTAFGGVFAWHETSSFDWLLFLLTLTGVLLLHAGTNVVNDYFDYRSGTDRINRNKTPFNGGSPFVVEGILTPEEIYRAALAFFVAGAAVGLLLAFLATPLIIPLGILGVGLGYFYTAPRVNLAARGVGEIAVGLGFGPLVVGGTYAVQTGVLAWTPFAAGFPIGLLIGLMLLINQFPDMEADGKVGKTHWVVRMGLSKAAVGYVALMTIAFVSIVVLWLAGVYPALALIGLIPGILAIRAGGVVLSRYSQFKELIPAQAMTIQTQLLVGALVTVGFLASGFL
jgi:1,4-dihydroxy-2-naphthoate octaprenyltransferase